MKYYDNTRLSGFKTCPRQYYFRHVLHWRREGIAPPLIFGLAWHDAMDVVWSEAKTSNPLELLRAATAAFNRKWEESGGPNINDLDIADINYWEPRTPGIAAEMLHNYINLRFTFLNEINLLACEKPFCVDIGLPNILYVGRFDKVFEYQNYIYVGEHKTTTAYKVDGGFRNEYLESWSPNSQIDGYIHAAHMLYGDRVKDAWVDAALVHKKVHDKFKFIPVSRSLDALGSWQASTVYWAGQIELELDVLNNLTSNQSSTVMTAFPMNTESCDGKYSPCSYRDICRFKSNPSTISEVPLGFIEEKWEPFNILNLEQIGLPAED